MKKTLFLLLCPAAMFAQFHFGAVAGGNMAMLQQDQDMRSELSYYAGAFAEFQSGSWGAFFEADYAPATFKATTRVTKFEAVNVYLGPKFYPTQTLSFAVGPYTQVLASVRQTYTYGSNGAKSRDDLTNYFQKSTHGVFASGEARLSKKLFVTARYSYMLSEMGTGFYIPNLIKQEIIINNFEEVRSGGKTKIHSCVVGLGLRI